MARKQIGVTDAIFAGWSGPWVDSNNNVYVLTQEVTSFVTQIHKAGADPLVDTWTVQDDAGRPWDTVAGAPGAGWQDGTKIHVVQWEPDFRRYEYSVFGTSDDSNADQWDGTIINEVVELPANEPITVAGFIAVRSDGDVIVVYNGDTDKIMGTDYDRCDYARREGGTWTAGINVAGDSVESHSRAHAIGRGASDEMFLFYDKGGSDYHRRLSSANVLSTGDSISNLNTTTVSPIVPHYDDNGVEVMTTGAVVSATSAKGEQLRNNTPQTVLDLSGTDFTAQRPCVAVDGTDAYLVYRSGTDDDIVVQSSANNNASWGDLATVSTSTAPTAVSANVIDHGAGKVLAVVYDDGDVYYDEMPMQHAISCKGRTRTDNYGTAVSTGMPTDDFTIAFWYRADGGNANFDHVCGAPNGAWSDGWGVYHRNANDLRIYVGPYTGSFVDLTGDVQNWHHYLITKDGTTMEVWKDNVSQGTDGCPATIGLYTLYLMGNSTAAYRADGSLCDFRVWDRVLSASERTTVYNNDESISSGAIREYQCQEGSGSTLNCEISAYDVTLVGSPPWASQWVYSSPNPPASPAEVLRPRNRRLDHLLRR